MAKQIALDLSEKSHLERLQALSGKEIAVLNSLVSGLESNLEQKSLQLQLLQDQKAALEVSLEAEKLKKPRDNLLQWFLQMAGALGVGYVIGKL